MNDEGVRNIIADARRLAQRDLFPPKRQRRRPLLIPRGHQPADRRYVLYESPLFVRPPSLRGFGSGLQERRSPEDQPIQRLRIERP
jgi:hypothetical protein